MPKRNGEAQWASEGDERVTRIGRFLRRTHLDEFPQFLNVLKGEMSLVGPRSERPSLIDSLQKDVPFYRARLLVKPGVTGWAQINYGYPETVDETIDKLEYDLFYIKNRTILLDLRIILGHTCHDLWIKRKIRGMQISGYWRRLVLLAHIWLKLYWLGAMPSGSWIISPPAKMKIWLEYLDRMELITGRSAGSEMTLNKQLSKV